MKKRILATLLALVMALSLLPGLAFAAEAEKPLPDWYFLFAIFKNVDADVVDGNLKTTHQTYTVPQEEIDVLRDMARGFEEYMNSTGVMRAHVEVVEIDAPITELVHPDGDSSRLRAEQAAPLLGSKVNLDRYDHVTCILNLNAWMGWAGLAVGTFENGTGLSNINHRNWENFQNGFLTNEKDWLIQVYVHEFLHFMERMSSRWGSTFVLHREGKTHYVRNDNWKTYYTDVILNRLDGDLDVFPDGGTGVHPAAWQYPPHVLRTMTELTVPFGVTSIVDRAFRNYTNLTSVTLPSTVTSIGHDAFLNCTNLTSVTIPSSVTSIDVSAFNGCTNLANVTIPASVTSIGNWAFAECAALTRISIPASVTSIGEVAFYKTGLTDVYYGGTEAQWKAIEIGRSNTPLTNAAIHYNSLMADVKTSDWFAQPVAWALEKGVTNGTGDGNFSPARTCNQGEILTFLWRAMGQPEPAGTVSGTQFYAKAAQWAKEQGLTDNFNAGAPCTRAMVLTYLWKLAGSPEAGNANFSDVSTDAGYAQAVAWAVAQGITKGTSSTTFSPDATCTRGEIVTFLYRALG